MLPIRSRDEMFELIMKTSQMALENFDHGGTVGRRIRVGTNRGYGKKRGKESPPGLLVIYDIVHRHPRDLVVSGVGMCHCPAPEVR